MEVDTLVLSSANSQNPRFLLDRGIVIPILRDHGRAKTSVYEAPNKVRVRP